MPRRACLIKGNYVYDEYSKVMYTMCGNSLSTVYYQQDRVL